MERNNILKKTKVISKNIIETMKLLLRYEKKYILCYIRLNVFICLVRYLLFLLLFLKKCLICFKLEGKKVL